MDDLADDTSSRPSHQHIVHFLEDEEILRKVPSMLPLLTGSVRSPRIAVSIEEKEIVVLLDTGAEVSVLPKSVMSDLIGDGSRHVKLGESKNVKPFANADVTIEGPWCLSVVVCGMKITHPFYSMDADVPAVVGIDLLTVAKLVIDVKNRCVYSHHHAYLEVEPATSKFEPVLRVENASSFTHPPTTTSISSSAQTDLNCVSTELGDISPSGVGAPSPPPHSDATRRPTLLHPPAPLPSPPLVTSPPCDTVKSCLDPQAPLYQPSGTSTPHSSHTPPFIPPPPPHYRPSTSELTARSLRATDIPPDAASDS